MTLLATAPQFEAMAANLYKFSQSSALRQPIALRTHPEFTGWTGLDLPLRHGGAGWRAHDMARLFRLCGRFDADLRDLAGGGHARLLTHASTRRFDQTLSAVARGTAYCAVAITEPDVGSDVRALASAARPSDGGYVLEGTKQYISRIDECTHFVVFAAVKRAKIDPLITAFLVSRDAAGLETQAMQASGLTATAWGRVLLKRVKVPSTCRIGGEGQGLSLFKRHFCYWRTMMAALAIGSAEAAIDQTGAWMKTRHAFGGPIGRFSHLQQAVAQWIARLRMAWLLVEDVAGQIDTRRWPYADAAMLKAEALEMAIGSTEWAMATFGGAGYDCAVGLEKRHRDLLGLRVADGTTDVLRAQVARSFLGNELYQLSLNRMAADRSTDGRPSRRFW